MKKGLFFITVIMTLLCGCNKNNEQQGPGVPGDFPGGPGGFDPGQGGDRSQAGSFDSSAVGELATFTVSPYSEAQIETEVVPSGNNDFVENIEFKAEIKIAYNADGDAVVTGAPD